MYEKIKLTNCARHCDVRVRSIELVDLLWFGTASDSFVRGCVGVDVPGRCVSLSLPGFVCHSVHEEITSSCSVCYVSVFRISLLRDSCRRLLARLTQSTQFMYLKMGTMKARADVRIDYSSSACNVRHSAPCSYQ